MLPSNWFENSACKGCEYGERITGGVFCIMTQGLVPCGYQGCKAQNDFYDEMYKKEKGMTLTELARELRKIFDFKYLTCDMYEKIRMWRVRPEFRNQTSIFDCGSWRIPRKQSHASREAALAEKHGFGRSLVSPLDLSEYADEKGNIDYSKCIVEVKE